MRQMSEAIELLRCIHLSVHGNFAAVYEYGTF